MLTKDNVVKTIMKISLKRGNYQGEMESRKRQFVEFILIKVLLTEQ